MVDEVGDSVGGFALEPIGDGSVGLHGEGDACVAKHSGDGFEVHTGGQRHGGGAVA
jgi:hypothetical protein